MTRDPERTRALLLDAARAEFARKGLAGARVNEIAARAGVNKQLISYHFGGKVGLYEAILQQWWSQEATFDEPGIDLAELVRRYLAAAFAQPHLQLMFLRETMDADTGDVAYEPANSEVVGLRARQDAGELDPRLDPGVVLLLLQAMVVSGTVFPAEVKRLLGVEAGSPEHLARMTEQLRIVVELLARR